MLAALVALLVGIHTIATGLGAVAATFAEIFYVKATADNRIDKRERQYFETTYWALRYGMMGALLSGLILLFVEYFMSSSPYAVFGPTLWMANTLVLVVTVAAYLLARKRIGWNIGSALIFTGWWMLFALDAWRAESLSYLTLLVMYAVFTLIALAFWTYVRALFNKHHYR